VLTLEQAKNVKIGDDLWWFDSSSGKIVPLVVIANEKDYSVYVYPCITGLVYGTKNTYNLYSKHIFFTKEESATFLLEQANAFRKQAIELLVDSKINSEEF
jgi:hypothetical protein